ncbi:MAG TPA: DUF5667 domain-containing protein [Patescibacteria group bacterium]|nr:DUF5667 domain-containing protein [Patescibacteria group bacterium]
MGFGRIICIIIFLGIVTSQSASAQEITPSVTPSPTPVAYTLPHPGILPGQPFYFLKDIRDTLVGFLISEPIKRAAYDVLQTDKKIQAAVMLLTQQKDEELVSQTLTQAERAFAHAIEQVTIAEKQGIEIKEIVAHLTIANRKHQEVLRDVIKEATGMEEKMLSQHLQIVLELEKKVRKLDRK